jgi:hypothetical protein
LAAVLLIGCGNKPPPPLSIKGKVVGIPVKSLEGLSLRFWPQQAGTDQSLLAVCQPDGSFTLECQPGTYKVTITPRIIGTGPPPPPDFPEIYMDSTKTPLEVTVREGDTQEKVLNVK